MFKKSNITGLEYKFLLFVSSGIPILIFINGVVVIYNFLFPYPPPQPPNFGITECYFPTFYESAFTLSFIISLLLTNILVLFRRIYLAWIVLVFPIFLFFPMAIQNISNFYNHSDNYPFRIFDQYGLFHQLQPQIYFFGFILFLFLWYSKVLIQSKMREYESYPKLP